MRIKYCINCGILYKASKETCSVCSRMLTEEEWEIRSFDPYDKELKKIIKSLKRKKGY